MADLSINNTPNVNKKLTDNKASSQYDKLKKDYDEMIKKTQSGDFANSPVALEKELAVLSGLKEAAISENLKDEQKWIEDRILTIYEVLSNRSSVEQPFYQDYSVNLEPHGTSCCPGTDNNQNPNISFDHFIELVQLEDRSQMFSSAGIFDEKAMEILKELYKYDSASNAALYILKKSSDLKGNIYEDRLPAIKMFLESGISPYRIDAFLEKCVNEPSEPDETPCIDFDLCKTACSLKALGIESDFDCIKVLDFFKNRSFEDEESVKISIKKMVDNNIDISSVLGILNDLAVESPETGLSTIDSQTVQSLCRAKKIMTLTRANEDNERNCAVNKLGLQVYKIGENYIIEKDGKIIKISDSNNGDSIFELQKQYEETINKIENNVLSCFVSDLVNKDFGTIDLKYFRTFINLRRMGITYNQLLDLTKKCIDSSGNINKAEISNISRLKQAEALSADIPVILDACEKENDESSSKSDIDNAVELVQCLIRGDQISEILPYMRENNEMTDFVLDFAPGISNPNQLDQLVDNVKLPNGEIDNNAILVFYDVFDKIMEGKPDNSPINYNEFIKTAIDLIDKAKDDKGINDDVEGSISMLLKQGKSIEQVSNLISICRNEHGQMDDELSALMWDLAGKNTDISCLTVILNSCKTDNDVNHSLLNSVSSLLKSGEKPENIVKYIIS